MITKKKNQINNIQTIYANDFKIQYDEHEFMLELGQTYFENEETEYSTRVILNPNSVLRL